MLLYKCQRFGLALPFLLLFACSAGEPLPVKINIAPVQDTFMVIVTNEHNAPITDLTVKLDNDYTLSAPAIAPGEAHTFICTNARNKEGQAYPSNRKPDSFDVQARVNGSLRSLRLEKK